MKCTYLFKKCKVHFKILETHFSCMTYHGVCNKGNMMGVTCGARTVYPYVDRNSKMTTTAGHSFYIGPIGSFYNQVNDTGSWGPLVYCSFVFDVDFSMHGHMK
jgi:hypothetical protein